MAFRPLSVISAVRQPGDTEDMAEERAQLANAKYIAARHWEALLGSRELCAQVSTDRAELQSELRRSLQKLRVLEKELVALNAEHKGFVLAYASLEGSSCSIERHLRQEIEAADMQRSKMQQGYKEQLHEQHGLVEELRKENECLMEDKAALTKEVSMLRRQLDIVQSSRATPAGPANMARSPLELGIGGALSTPFADSPRFGVASLSGAGSPMSSSSVASHKSEVFNCLMEDLVRVTKELSREANFVQTPGAIPLGAATMASHPLDSSPSSQQRAMLTTPHPLPVYQDGMAVMCEPKAGSWYGQLHGSNPRKGPITSASVTKHHLSSHLEVQSLPAELDAGDISSSTPPLAKAQITMGPSPESPKSTPLVNRLQRPYLANPSNELTPQARSPLVLSIDGTPEKPYAGSPMSGIARLSGADSPMSSSSVASHNSDVLDYLMEDLEHVTKELSRGPGFVQTTRATPAGPAPMVCEPKAGGWYGCLHDSNPLRVTFKRRAEPSDPIPLFTLSSPPPACYSIPLLVPSALSADISSSPSLSCSPVLSELPSPRTTVKALTAMGTPPEIPKATPLVSMSERPALANLTNTLTPQARVTSGLAASVQTPGKATPPTSAGGRHLSAFLQRSPSPCPRPQTSPPKVVVTGNRSACSIRSNRYHGFEASPGTPPALDLLSPARALGNMPRAVGCVSMALPPNAAARSVSTQVVISTTSIRALVSSPTAFSPPRAVGSNLRGSLNRARASGYTPTAPSAEPAVSVHSVMSIPDQEFNLTLSVPETQGPTSSPAVQSAVPMSSATLVPLQLTPVQQPLQAHGPSACSVAASNGRTRAVYGSAVSSGQVHRRSSTSSSIADRPAWSASFSRSPAVHTRLVEDPTPVSPRLTSGSLHRAASSTQPSPTPVRAVADSPTAEPSSVQAIRRTGSNAAAARLLSTAKTEASTRTAAQPGAVRPTAAQPNAGRAAVRGTSRAAPTRAGPVAPVPAAQRLTFRSKTHSSKAAASMPAEQSVAKYSTAASGRLGVVQNESGAVPVEPKQTSRGQGRTVKKKAAPARTQPARRAKEPGHTWKF
ncbi:hypothetical protein WJX77_002633 [Trebouxia sp. C0004]